MMVETRFPGIHGDIANGCTRPFPLHCRILRGASPPRVVRERAEGLLNAAKELTSLHHDIGAIVLECTNMAPHAADIRKVTGLPVHSICTLVRCLQSGLVPRQFPVQLDDPARPAN